VLAFFVTQLPDGFKSCFKALIEGNEQEKLSGDPYRLSKNRR